MNLTLNMNWLGVKDPLFLEHEFFDPYDLIQVKYEMLRKVRIENIDITTASKAFGLSRPAFYKAQLNYTNIGISGIFPKKRGPQQAHKLTEPIYASVRSLLLKNPLTSAQEISQALQKKFSISIHPRTIKRISVCLKKKALILPNLH